MSRRFKIELSRHVFGLAVLEGIPLSLNNGNYLRVMETAHSTNPDFLEASIVIPWDAVVSMTEVIDVATPDAPETH